MLSMAKNFRCVETKLIHAGEPEPRIEGAVSMPIFQTAMFEYAGETDYNALRYIRLNNTPNHLVLHEKLAALENGEAALVTASGMAAISTPWIIDQTQTPRASEVWVSWSRRGGSAPGASGFCIWGMR